MLKKVQVPATFKSLAIDGDFIPKRKKPVEHKKPIMNEFRERMASSMEGLLFSDADGVTTKTKETRSDRVEQVLVMDGDKSKELKWTILLDPFAEEFSALARDLEKVESEPPLYVQEFHNARLATSHKGVYTMILASYDMKVEELAETFKELSRKKAIFD